MNYEKEYEIKGISGEGPYLILHQKFHFFNDIYIIMKGAA
jgi:hypothetical protein